MEETTQQPVADGEGTLTTTATQSSSDGLVLAPAAPVVEGDPPSMEAIAANAAAQKMSEETGVSKIEAIIQTWFLTHVHNSPVAYEERAWNAIVDAKAKLLDMVKGL